METVIEETPRKSLIAAGLVFLMHQVMAYWVVSVSAKLPVALAADLLWPFGVRIHHFPVILTLPPYYPLQIIWALFLGWSLSGYLRHQSMLWVWVIPTVVLSYVFIQFPARPVLLPDRAVLSSSSGLSHFFGWGCRVKDLCNYLHPAFLLYCATAYSLGAWWARKMSWLSRYTEVMSDINMPRACLVGTGFVCLDVGSSWRYFAHNRLAQTWIGVVGGLWGLTIMFAFSTYIFMVVIGMIGRRFFLTQWFLNQAPPTVVGEMKVPA